MRVVISLLLVFSAFCNAFSQYADGRYHSRMTQDGMLFFINPHKLKELHDLKMFKYDMTLLTWNDDVTINFTFESRSMDTPENISINVGEKTFKCEKSSVLFIDLKKNHYEIRVSSVFPLNDIIMISHSENPPFFTFFQNGEIKTASYSQKDWLKEKKILNDILNIYLYSKSL